jgi:hypothetical protein
MDGPFNSIAPDVHDLAGWTESSKTLHWKYNSFCGVLKIAKYQATKDQNKKFVLWKPYYIWKAEQQFPIKDYMPRGPTFYWLNQDTVEYFRKDLTNNPDWQVAAIVLPDSKEVELVVQQGKMF